MYVSKAGQEGVHLSLCRLSTSLAPPTLEKLILNKPYVELRPQLFLMLKILNFKGFSPRSNHGHFRSVDRSKFGKRI